MPIPDLFVNIAIAFAAIGVALALVLVLFALVPRADPKLAELERKSERSSVRSLDPPVASADPLDAADREAAALMKRGKKIEAIQVYRQMTGVGLAEAKAAVERL